VFEERCAQMLSLHDSYRTGDWSAEKFARKSILNFSLNLLTTKVRPFCYGP
jgi:hypothetical protein